MRVRIPHPHSTKQSRINTSPSKRSTNRPAKQNATSNTYYMSPSSPHLLPPSTYPQPLPPTPCYPHLNATPQSSAQISHLYPTRAQICLSCSHRFLFQCLTSLLKEIGPSASTITSLCNANLPECPNGRPTQSSLHHFHFLFRHIERAPPHPTKHHSPYFPYFTAFPYIDTFAKHTRFKPAVPFAIPFPPILTRYVYGMQTVYVH